MADLGRNLFQFAHRLETVEAIFVVLPTMCLDEKPYPVDNAGCRFTGWGMLKSPTVGVAEICATNIVLLIGRLLAISTSRNFIVSTSGSGVPTNVPCNPEI